jgi:hypothetical protein
LPDASVLAAALRDQQQAQQLLARLDAMRDEQTLTDGEYSSMRRGYLTQANEASVRVETAREAVRREAAAAEARLADLRKQLRESQLRQKVGEIAESAHLAERQRLDPAIAQHEDFIGRLNSIAAVDEPEELAQHVGDPHPEPVVPEVPAGIGPAPAAPPPPASVVGATVPSVPAAVPVVGLPTAAGSGLAATLAGWGARMPLASEPAMRLAWLCVGAMFVAAVQSLPSYDPIGIVLAALATVTGVAAAVSVTASDTIPFRLGRVGAASLGVLLWLAGIAFLWGRISWWFFGLASVVLLASSLALMKE